MRSLLSISTATLVLLYLAGRGSHAEECGRFGRDGCGYCTYNGCWFCEYDQTCRDNSQQGNCSRTCPTLIPTNSPFNVDCPFPASSRASHQWVANQVDRGNASPYTWWISACKGNSPAGCSQPAFLAQYSNDGGMYCVNVWTYIVQNWKKHNSGFFETYTATFGSDGNGNPRDVMLARVTIVCDGQEDSLQHSGDVDIINAPNGLITWNFNLKTSPAGCKAVTSAPVETPSPTSSSNGDCSGHLSCAGCTQASSGLCGWCTQTKTCSQGNSNGPSSGSCPTGDWRWYSSSC